MYCFVTEAVCKNISCGFRDLSYNNLVGDIPSWAFATNLQMYVLLTFKEMKKIVWRFI
jgi:hypothetical protein